MSEPRRRTETAALPADAPVEPTGIRTRGQLKPQNRHLPPYKVILHNDDVNDMGFVVRTIMELTHLGKPDATQKMLEAHNRGCALLLVTHKERAELYAEQFLSKGLTATIEPA